MSFATVYQLCQSKDKAAVSDAIGEGQGGHIEAGVVQGRK